MNASSLQAGTIPPARDSRSRPGTSRRAVLALAGCEGRRALKHPFTLVAAVLYLAPELYGHFAGSPDQTYPILQNADRATQIAAFFILGSAAFLVADLAVLRPVRHGTEQFLSVQLLRSWERAAAVLLSVGAVVGFTIILVACRVLLVLSAPARVGRLNGLELIAGPLAVAFLGCFGVLLGLLVRSARVAPVVLVSLFAVTLFATIVGGPARWLLPVAIEPPQPALPVDLLGRPAAAHALYLAALILLVCGLAAMSTGSRRASASLLVPAVVLGAISLPGQWGTPNEQVVRARDAAVTHPARFEVCQRVGTVTYCAFPDFRQRIEQWNDVVTGVTREVPGSGNLAVRQRVSVGQGSAGALVSQAPLAEWVADDSNAGTPEAVTVGTEWGSGEPELELAAGIAYRLVVGGPTRPDIEQVCGSQGVVLLWLAGQSDPRVLDALKARLGNGSGDVVLTPGGFATGFAVSHRDAMVANKILERPVDVTGATVRRNWATLSRSGTTTEQAADILGVPGPLAPAAAGIRC